MNIINFRVGCKYTPYRPVITNSPRSPCKWKISTGEFYLEQAMILFATYNHKLEEVTGDNAAGPTGQLDPPGQQQHE